MGQALSNKHLAEFKERLRKRFDELRAEVRQELLRADDEHYARLASEVHDAGEESVADLLADVNLAIINQHIGEIRETEAAILRIARGTYGVCVNCGSDIGYRRLEAAPAARRCIDCQTHYEHSHTQPGHPSL